jgi:hypothetical protein
VITSVHSYKKKEKELEIRKENERKKIIFGRFERLRD